METSHFHILPPISNVPFLQFLRWSWSSHAQYALIFPPSLPRSKSLTTVVRKTLPAALVDTFYRTLIIFFLTALPLSLYASLSLAMQSTPWRVAQLWVCVKFRCFLLLRKGLSGTTPQSSRFKNNAVCFTDCRK